MSSSRTINRLLLLYNADSGKWNALMDTAKKLFTVNGCALCSITHGVAGEKDEWKDCRNELGVPVEYVHRDEMTARLQNAAGVSLPVVVAEVAGEYTVVMSSDVLERCRGSIADFKGRLALHASMKGLKFPEEPGI